MVDLVGSAEICSRSGKNISMLKQQTKENVSLTSRKVRATPFHQVPQQLSLVSANLGVRATVSYIDGSW
jgi:hypothetical protein